MTVTGSDIQAIVGLQLGRERIEPGDRLVEDLGAESGDFVTIVAIVEERYGVVIEEVALAAIVTVDDLQQVVLARSRSG